MEQLKFSKEDDVTCKCSAGLWQRQTKARAWGLQNVNCFHRCNSGLFKCSICSLSFHLDLGTVSQREQVLSTQYPH